MNTRKLNRHPIFNLLIALAIFPLLLTACQAAAPATSIPTIQPSEQPNVQPTAAVSATQPPAGLSGDIRLDLAGLASDTTVETIAAVPPTSDRPYWEVLPEYRVMTLQGYPVSSHLMKAQIFIFPAADLARFNEAAGQKVTDLQALLNTRQAGQYLPFLPMYNAQQVFHAQEQYLNFKNGRGVRFLTEFDQAPLLINNYELIYTFQGLTSDGKYYIAAVLPLTHPELPATQQILSQQAEQLKDFPAYVTKTVAWLNQQPAASFTPDLAKLDAVIQSIEVK